MHQQCIYRERKHDMLSAMVFVAQLAERQPDSRFQRKISPTVFDAREKVSCMQIELPEGHNSKYDYFLTLGHEVDWVVNMVIWLHQ